MIRNVPYVEAHTALLLLSLSKLHELHKLIAKELIQHQN